MVFWRPIIFGQLWSSHFFWNVGCFGVRFPLNTTVFFNVYFMWWTTMLSTLVETQTEDRQEKSVSQKKTHHTLVNKPFELWSVKHNGEEEMQNPQGKSGGRFFSPNFWSRSTGEAPDPGFSWFFSGHKAYHKLLTYAYRIHLVVVDWR